MLRVSKTFQMLVEFQQNQQRSTDQVFNIGARRCLLHLLSLGDYTRNIWQNSVSALTVMPAAGHQEGQPVHALRCEDRFWSPEGISSIDSAANFRQVGVQVSVPARLS